jgi:putative ABC transport system permease protein
MTMGAENIHFYSLAGYYTLLIIPLGIFLWFRVPIIGKTLLAIMRMTVQLLFVGLYLQVVFKWNNPWINGLWLFVMIGVADFSIIRACDLKLKRFVLPLCVALIAGTSVPLFAFIGPLLNRPNLMDAQYVIPIGGMILGNCLRADIIGIRNFYENIRRREKTFFLALSQGATLNEAIRPFLKDACQAALLPTIATIATIGLVALPGMMTGVILGGASPMTAIKYQIGIMIAIFTGTSITVLLGVLMSVRSSFTAFGVLNADAFRTRLTP